MKMKLVVAYPRKKKVAWSYMWNNEELSGESVL